MKKCNKKLKELIEDMVIPDIEDHIDEIFEAIANDKNASEKTKEELEQMHEMRKEFQLILDDIDNNELEQEECMEIYEEITSMIEDNEKE